MLKGCYTALVTPFDGENVDYEGLDRLCEFQIQNNISGILAVGTTGESPTLTWEEHNKVVETIAAKCKGNCFCIAGTGSNNTTETIEGTRHAKDAGVDAVLLVDPYYNGPSSLEIRREYVEPVAREFPDLPIVPYVIPGRTGAQLLPQDLGIMAGRFPNVSCVKEATGDLENMKATRAACGPDFSIMSGDDSMTLAMMTNPDVLASGVISVMSNIAPKAVGDMVRAIQANDLDTANSLAKALEPLFNLVVVTTMEESPKGEVKCRARNPLPAKTLMAVLGMPGGACRRPLGKMTHKGLETVLAAARQVLANNPEIFAPAAGHFNLDIEKRLHDPASLEGLVYETY